MWMACRRSCMMIIVMTNDFARELLESRGREIASKLSEWTVSRMSILPVLAPVVLVQKLGREFVF